jgi:DNA-binding CsgD family transcriptional regulator
MAAPDRRSSEGYFSERRTLEPSRRALTKPEIAALSCVSHGLTAQMTAEVLGKSHYTIKEQLASARHALGAKNTSHAVAIAFRIGAIR